MKKKAANEMFKVGNLLMNYLLCTFIDYIW